MGTRPILQVLKMFQVFFPVPVQMQCERFLLKPYNPFFPIPVLVPVPNQDSVNTPSLVFVMSLVLLQPIWEVGYWIVFFGALYCAFDRLILIWYSTKLSTLDESSSISVAL